MERIDNWYPVIIYTNFQMEVSSIGVSDILHSVENIHNTGKTAKLANNTGKITITIVLIEILMFNRLIYNLVLKMAKNRELYHFTQFSPKIPSDNYFYIIG